LDIRCINTMSQSQNSQDDGEMFSTQFSELLKPIRELTKQHCWELNIAEKLDEYVHYVQDLQIEVNVNGEPMKLDFAKAAMVVQNSVQIYSKKVEYLWLLLQDVIEFLSSHGKTDEEQDGEGQNKPKKNFRKRHHKNTDVDLTESVSLKFRKFSSRIKLKGGATKQVKLFSKRVQTLPYEILQLEEVVSSANPLKIKLFTLSKEHLGYPSDLRSNFLFDHLTFFLRIHHSQLPDSANKTLGRDGEMLVDNQSASDCPVDPDLVEERDPSNLECDINTASSDDDDQVAPADSDAYPTTEEHTDRMQLRQRNPPEPEMAAETVLEVKDPWKGLEPYLDEAIKKSCGKQSTCKLPSALQKKKRKEAGKEPTSDEPVMNIDEFLNEKGFKKTPLNKFHQPDPEFWEDYVYFTKTIGSIIKKHLMLRSAGTVVEEVDETLDCEDNVNYGNPDAGPCNDGPQDSFEISKDEFNFGPDVSESNTDKELDESKEFFELVQQFMAEYTASAKEFVHSTESTRRVQAWHDMIKPRLQEAELRRDFDIHVYGSQILDEFGSESPIGSQASFSNIIQKKPKREVARYFLATLQLANAYNVEIAPPDDTSLMNGMTLKLLTRQRHHEQVQEFIT